MINRKAFIYLIITLLIGFTLGMFSNELYQVRKERRMRPMTPQFEIGSMLARELQLTDEQIAQLSDTFREFEIRAKQNRERIRQEVQEGLDSLRQELLPYLTDDQIQIFDRWIERRPPVGPGQAPRPRAPGQYPPDHGPGPPPPGSGPPPDHDLPPAVSDPLPQPSEQAEIQDTLHSR